jgi:hypothetical protein
MPYGIVLSDSITDSSGGVLAPSSSVFRNRLINADMRIDQRNAGASVTPTNQQYSVDRWQCVLTQASKYSVQQNAGSVTPPAGFTNYLGITSLSSYSVTSGDSFSIAQKIEGFNFADLGWGAAGASTVTFSFWVRSSLTGTFGGSLYNSAADRCYPYSYTISAANTWERKTITITGDTTGTWLKTNGTGLTVIFGLGQGSTFSGTAGAWTGSTILNATGATSVVGTNGATFYITGVQLEKGTTATSFDYRPYTTELQLCQRYFQSNGVAVETGSLFQSWAYPVQFRTAPTIAGGASGFTDFGTSIGSTTTKTCTVYQTTRSGYQLLTFSAEL